MNAMGYNTPDDCPWPSDQDYYDWTRGPFDKEEADEDPSDAIDWQEDEDRHVL